ncbi:MAG: PDZ domain-containing protein [Polyangiaceae bacterium]
MGAVFARDNPSGRVFVRDAPSDMGAAHAGVMVGDELIAVDGHPVNRLTADDLHKLLAGKVGSKVVLQVKRNGEMKDLTVERGPLRQSI